MGDEDREKMFAAVDDLVGELLHYGRKEDEDLPRGRIEEMVGASDGALIDEIADRFRAQLCEALGYEVEDDHG